MLTRIKNDSSYIDIIYQNIISVCKNKMIFTPRIMMLAGILSAFITTELTDKATVDCVLFGSLGPLCMIAAAQDMFVGVIIGALFVFPIGLYLDYQFDKCISKLTTPLWPEYLRHTMIPKFCLDIVLISLVILQII